MSFWKKFFAILQMAPMIINLVKQVESALPGKGQGAHKLNLVLDIVGQAAATEPDIEASISKGDLATAATGIVNATVAAINLAKPQP